MLKTKKIEVIYSFALNFNVEYIREGKEAMIELIELLKPETWVFEKTSNKCDLYVR